MSSRRRNDYSSSRQSSTKSWRKSTNDSSRHSREDSREKRENSPKSSRPERPESASSKKPELPSTDPVPESEDEYLMTPAEMNALGAKILKAEIAGNKALAAQLQAKLDKAREVSKGKRIIVAKPEHQRSDRRGAAGGRGGHHGGRMNAEMHKYKFDQRHSLKGMVSVSVYLKNECQSCNLDGEVLLI